MVDYEPLMSFGEDVAEIYDAEPDAGHRGHTFLESPAGGSSALELAIGTGRVSLSLAARGVRVDAINFSAPWSPSCAPSLVVTRLR